LLKLSKCEVPSLTIIITLFQKSKQKRSILPYRKFKVLKKMMLDSLYLMLKYPVSSIRYVFKN